MPYERKYDEQGRALFAIGKMTPEQKARAEQIAKARAERYPLKVGDLVRYSNKTGTRKWDGRVAEVIDVSPNFVHVKHKVTGHIERHQWHSGYVTNMERIDETGEVISSSLDVATYRIGKLIHRMSLRYSKIEILRFDDGSLEIAVQRLDGVEIVEPCESLADGLEAIQKFDDRKRD